MTQQKIVKYFCAVACEGGDPSPHNDVRHKCDEGL